MSTLTKSATPAELAYDRAVSEYNDFPSEDTAQFLWVAELALKRERKQARISYDKHEDNYKKMIKELNRNLDYGQGRKQDSYFLSDQLVTVSLILMGVVGFVAWLCR